MFLGDGPLSLSHVTKKHSHYGHSPNKRLCSLFLWPNYIGYNDKILGKANGIKFGEKLNFFDMRTWGTQQKHHLNSWELGGNKLRTWWVYNKHGFVLKRI